MTELFVSLRKLYVSWQFVQFLAVGGIAALLHWLARFAFNVYFSFTIAVVLAYAVGILVAFTLNRLFVFPQSSRPMHQELTLFTIVNIAAFPFVIVISIVLGRYVLTGFLPSEWAHAIGHGIGVLSPVLVNFAVHKLITFKSD